MKTNQLKFSGAVLLLLVTIFSVTAAIVKVDFSGDWTLDTAKSNMGEGQRGGRGAAQKLKVTQAADGMLTIVRTSNGMNGEVTTTDKLTADGKESASTGGMEGSTRKASLTWAGDKNTANISAATVMNFNGQSFENSIKEVWTLSADGKTLTINSESTSQRGVTKLTLVYNK